MKYAPSTVVRYHLLNVRVVHEVGPTATWPIYENMMPDTEEVPDNAVAIFDQLGITEGRYMQTGEVVEKPSMQIMVRSIDYLAGWSRIHQIAKKLDEVKRDEVAILYSRYRIDAIVQRGPVLPLGVDPETLRYFVFTVNFTASIEELEEEGPMPDATVEIKQGQQFALAFNAYDKDGNLLQLENNHTAEMQIRTSLSADSAVDELSTTNNRIVLSNSDPNVQLLWTQAQSEALDFTDPSRDDWVQEAFGDLEIKKNGVVYYSYRIKFILILELTKD